MQGHTASNVSAKSNLAVASQASDQALMQSIADGDKGALKVLFVRHHLRVYRFVMRFVGNEATAEEIVNEVFLDAWRQATKFEARCQVATWLLAIARFKAITELRRRSDAQLDDGVA